MIGVKGEPLTASFEWVKWRRTKRELTAIGATKVLTDTEAKRLGYVVAAAKSMAQREGN